MVFKGVSNLVCNKGILVVRWGRGILNRLLPEPENVARAQEVLKAFRKLERVLAYPGNRVDNRQSIEKDLHHRLSEQPVTRQQGLPPVYRNIVFDGLPPAAQIGIPATINQAFKNIGRAPVPWNHTPMPEEYGNGLFVYLFPLCPGFIPA